MILPFLCFKIYIYIIIFNLYFCLKELEYIDPILEGLQNSLARKLNYIESTNGKGRQSTSSLMNWGSKLSRGLDRMGMGNAMVRTEEASGYVEVLLKVFQQ